MIKRFIMKINAEFALFTWSCLMTFFYFLSDQNCRAKRKCWSLFNVRNIKRMLIHFFFSIYIYESKNFIGICVSTGLIMYARYLDEFVFLLLRGLSVCLLLFVVYTRLFCTYQIINRSRICFIIASGLLREHCSLNFRDLRLIKLTMLTKLYQ